MPPTDIKEPPRHLPKFWHFSSSDDIANVEWEVCDCHLGNLDLLHGGEQAIQGISFRSVMGWMSNVFVPHFFPGYIFGETGTHLFSLFYLFLRTNHYPASWWHEKPKNIFFWISPQMKLSTCCWPGSCGRGMKSWGKAIDLSSLPWRRRWSGKYL